MTYPTEFHAGAERRAYQGRLSQTPPRISSQFQPYSEVFTRCPNRQYMVSLLDRQVALSQERQYPLCLALVEVPDLYRLDASYGDSALAAVGKIFRSQLRPTDLIVRYKDFVLALVLLECDESGGSSVCARLNKVLSRRLYFGKKSVQLNPIFAYSAEADGYGSAGNSVLSSAEFALDRARTDTGHQV